MPIIFEKVPIVEEMWAIDEQNHGESAILNDEALRTRTIGKPRFGACMLRHSSATGIEEYGDLIAHFLHSPIMMGKKVVLVGHSTGTCAWYVRLHSSLIHHPHFFLSTIAASQITLPVSPIISLILFEPVMVLQPITDNDERLKLGERTVKGVKTRQCTFATREHAEKYVKSRPPWKSWDERMIQCYLVCI
jgi:hypothetical protein